jgi:hypothetical protein
LSTLDFLVVFKPEQVLAARGMKMDLPDNGWQRR